MYNVSKLFLESIEKIKRFFQSKYDATVAGPVWRNLKQTKTPEGSHILWLVGLKRKHKTTERQIEHGEFHLPGEDTETVLVSCK